ncbi:radical SAM protein [candidate division WOR-3 bacterium]|nr:radical SAM protein [candidate division WOR-3 bacterium]
MNKADSSCVYGPVPSRRLGRSLGVDLVPFKTCTYDCVYCQLGRTRNRTTRREEYVRVDDVVDELKRKLDTGSPSDYITLAGSGEPTLNAQIGDLIRRIKRLTLIPVAVCTNGSLLWMREVRDSLLAADLVLPSLDAGDEELFRYVNRPHPGIAFDRMVDGLVEFTSQFTGSVWLEVLLLDGVTGIPFAVKKLAALVERINPARVQLNTVSRPPAEEFALAVPDNQMERFRGFFPVRTEVICETGPKRLRPSLAGRASDADILALLSRRPCTARDVARGLGIHLMEAIKLLDRLVSAERARTLISGSRTFYTIVGAARASGS